MDRPPTPGPGPVLLDAGVPSWVLCGMALGLGLERLALPLCLRLRVSPGLLGPSQGPRQVQGEPVTEAQEGNRDLVGADSLCLVLKCHKTPRCCLIIQGENSLAQP